jgi:predicted permease
LTDLLILFSNNLLPIFLASGAGLLAARYLGVNPRSISKIAFYIFSPCLVFNLLSSDQLNGGGITQMALFAALIILIMGALTAFIGYVLRFERSLIIGLMLTVMFGNVGNFGLSLNLFAFGQEALVYASVYFISSVFLVYTVGVLLASWGKSNIKSSMLGILKVPVIYAVVLALLFRVFNWSLPLPIERTVSILSDAAIPVMMVLLGIQLYHARLSKSTFSLGLSNILRLVVAPVLAIGLGLLFQLDGPGYQAAVVESAVPTAVLVTVLAIEYDIQPAFMTTAVFTSTILSPLTITPLLAFLGA